MSLCYIRRLWSGYSRIDSHHYKPTVPFIVICKGKLCSDVVLYKIQPRSVPIRFYVYSISALKIIEQFQIYDQLKSNILLRYSRRSGQNALAKWYEIKPGLKFMHSC